MTGGRGAMTELKNWKEVTRGLFRYVIAASVCYEIHVLYHAEGTDILTAKASLFLVGSWMNGKNNWFERECLLAEQPVFECLKMAQKDNEENNE
jgi:hypothetical protein